MTAAYISRCSVCRKTSIVIQKWGLGRSPKAGRRDASPRIHPRHGCRACMPKGSMQGRIQVVEQSRCRTHRQQTTTIAQMQSQPSIHSLSRGKGVFGKDAEIRTHQALHEAKPIECPKGDRDNKSEVYFKNRLFLQSEAVRQMSCRLFIIKT